MAGLNSEEQLNNVKSQIFFTTSLFLSAPAPSSARGASERGLLCEHEIESLPVEFHVLAEQIVQP